MCNYILYIFFYFLVYLKKIKIDKIDIDSLLGMLKIVNLLADTTGLLFLVKYLVFQGSYFLGFLIQQWLSEFFKMQNKNDLFYPIIISLCSPLCHPSRDPVVIFDTCSCWSPVWVPLCGCPTACADVPTPCSSPLLLRDRDRLERVGTEYLQEPGLSVHAKLWKRRIKS